MGGSTQEKGSGWSETREAAKDTEQGSDGSSREQNLMGLGRRGLQRSHPGGADHGHGVGSLATKAPGSAVN